MKNYQKLGKYIILEKLDQQGGMGEISLAVDSSSETPNELLIVKAGGQSSQNGPELAKQIENEARLASQLKHTNICSYKDSFLHEGRFYYVRKYINGLSLKKVMDHKIEQKQGFQLAEALYIALEISKGLSYLHDFEDPENGILHGIVHGDLNPSNILFSRDQKMNLIDFGLSRPIKDYWDISLQSNFASLGYISLRRLESKTVARTDDVIALGFIFWELLTNHRYYGNKTRPEIIEEIRKSAFKDPRSVNRNVPEAAAEFIQKCFVSDTVFGFSSIDAAQAELQELMKKFAPAFDASAFWSRLYSAFEKNFKDMKQKDEQNLLLGRKITQSHLRARKLEDSRTPQYVKISKHSKASVLKWASTFTEADRRLLKILFGTVIAAEILWFGGSRWIQSASFNQLLSRLRVVPQSIRIVSDPAGGNISLNGVDLHLQTPADITLPEDRKVFLISIQKDQLSSYTFTVPTNAREIDVDLAHQTHAVQSK